MSGWADYGFPDITGVPFQTALEGLAAAVDERCFARLGYHPIADSYGGAVAPLSDALYWIRNTMDFTMNTAGAVSPPGAYLLPDGTQYGPTEAAEYLGEELITLPAIGIRGHDWTDPFSAIGYDWIMQRYRMLNVVYLSKAWYSGYTLTGRAAYTGAKTSAEAMRKANENYYEQVVPGRSPLYVWLARGDDGNGGRNVSYGIWAPASFEYTLYVPAELTFRGTARTYSTPDDWADPAVFYGFGTGIVEGDNVLPLPVDGPFERGDNVDLSAWDRQIVTAVQGMTYADKPGRSPGMVFPFELVADLRNSFDFYDPTEGA